MLTQWFPNWGLQSFGGPQRDPGDHEKLLLIIRLFALSSCISVDIRFL